MPSIDLIHGDCMEYMAKLPDKAFDLAIVDPPYNIGKAKWDKWKIENEYVDFIISCMSGISAVLKDNASLYLFHNDFNQLSKIQTRIEKETNLILRQFIVWNKRFDGSKNKGYFDGYVCVENLRNYNKMAEYICFYTFQDETGLSKMMGNCIYPIRDYIRTEIIRAKGNISFKKINSVLGTATNGGGVASACLSLDKTCPAMITKEHYLKLREWLNNSQEYEYLRKEYEDLRYFFNNQKTHHSVWNIDIADKETKHKTEKPLEIYQTIFQHSAKPNAKIIDPFLGSGSSAIAADIMGYDFTGIEIDKDYYEAALDRFNRHKQQLVMEF